MSRIRTGTKSIIELNSTERRQLTGIFTPAKTTQKLHRAHNKAYACPRFSTPQGYRTPKTPSPKRKARPPPTPHRRRPEREARLLSLSRLHRLRLCWGAKHSRCSAEYGRRRLCAAEQGRIRGRGAEQGQRLLCLCWGAKSPSIGCTGAAAHGLWRGEVIFGRGLGLEGRYAGSEGVSRLRAFTGATRAGVEEDEVVSENICAEEGEAEFLCRRKTNIESATKWREGWKTRDATQRTGDWKDEECDEDAGRGGEKRARRGASRMPNWSKGRKGRK
ncbi:hypothetical protein C8R44DRAFT_735860 [Mycena epipterygia]|nr:hypothetical protein C8R44DRAFT_735860 [Mycena epipterygia]